jgi:ankyrin repeat protein
MVKEIWKYLHKPRYVDVDQLDAYGRTAAQVAAQEGHADIVELLQGLGVDAGVMFAAGDGGGDTDSDSDSDSD